MSSALIVLGQMVVLFVMMAIGTVGYKTKMFKEDFSHTLSKLVVNVFNPLLIVNSAISGAESISGELLKENLITMLLYYVILILAGFLIPLFLRPKKRYRSIFVLLVTFTNVGFMGIPVIKSLYGDGMTAFVTLYLLGFNILAYTFGYYFANRSAKELTGETKKGQGVAQTIRKILNPGVIACFLSIIIMLTKIRLPAFVSSFTNYMGTATVPLSMLVVGISIGKADLKNYFSDWRMNLMIVLRQLFLPILLSFAMKWTSFNPVIIGVFLLEMAMPCGTIMGMMVSECGGDGDYCMKGIVLSSLVSVVSIPIVAIFLP